MPTVNYNAAIIDKIEIWCNELDQYTQVFCTYRWVDSSTGETKAFEKDTTSEVTSEEESLINQLIQLHKNRRASEL